MGPSDRFKALSFLPSFLPIWMVIKVVSHLHVGSSSSVLHCRDRKTVNPRADPTDYLQLSLSQQGETTPPLHSTVRAMQEYRTRSSTALSFTLKRATGSPSLHLLHTTGTHGPDQLLSNNLTQLVHQHSPLPFPSDPQTNTKGRINV